MLPGDVYYYSSNSLVLCVKQTPEAECEQELALDPLLVTRKSAGLNPNASVFQSTKASSPTDTVNWDGVNANVTNEYQFTNGEVTPTEPGGVFSVLPDSPVQSADGVTLLDNQLVYTADSSVVDNEETQDESMDEDGLRNVLKKQLEELFSRDVLASDSYLQSQMDDNKYVPITTIASLQQIQNLTTDVDLITNILQESPHVQVDEKGEKVRPNHNRCIVILREVPESTPKEDVEKLFSGENCPKFVSCEFAANDNWYVTFDSDADAQRAYQYLREDVCNFLGKPIMARIKAKPLIRMTYPRNGYRNRFHEQQQQQQVTAGQPVTQTLVQTPQMPQQSEAPPTPTQQQFSVQQQVPLMPSVQQYLNNQQSIPFFTPNPLIAPWSSSSTLFDPSMDNSLLQVLAINGYQATGVNLKPNVPPRHQQYNANRNSRNPRPSRHINQDNRQSMENRQNYDRISNNHRTSPRMHDQQMSPSPYRNRGDNLNHSHMAQSSPSLDSNSNHLPLRERQSDGPPPAQRGYRSRRRREEDGPIRSMRQNSTTGAPGMAKDKPMGDKFDLENHSFPPLPGPTPANSSSSNEVFESKLSDVVKGTAKPVAREVVAKPTVTVNPMVTTTNTTTTSVASSAVPSQPESPPPKKENISNNSGSVINGALTMTSDTSTTTTTSSCAPPRVPSPPPVSPQKPVKISGNKPEISPKIVEEHITPSKPVQPVSHQVKTKQVDKAPYSSSVKLSYAQMVQRGRDNDITVESKQLSDSEQDITPQNGARPTLKEQSQTIKTAKGTSKETDSPRKDFEPKDRHFSGRRAKENRERRDRRRSEREGIKLASK